MPTKSVLKWIAGCAVLCVCCLSLSVYYKVFNDKGPIGPIVTMAEYNQIQKGMTFKEVSNIISSTIAGSNQVKDQSTISMVRRFTYEWKNDDGSYARVTFVDYQDKLPALVAFKDQEWLERH
jgi:hypothetical protein